MSRILAGVLVVLAIAVVASARIPDPDLSFVDMDQGIKGLATCPAADGPSYKYVTVTAKESGGTGIEGIPAGSFFFDVTGGEVSFEVARVAGTPAHGESTNINGEIKFAVIGDESISYGTQLDIGVQIYTVVVNDVDTLLTNSVDYEPDGDCDNIDFVAFGGDFGGTNERSDFDWDGDVDNIDFVTFGGHFGHTAP